MIGQRLYSGFNIALVNIVRLLVHNHYTIYVVHDVIKIVVIEIRVIALYSVLISF